MASAEIAFNAILKYDVKTDGVNFAKLSTYLYLNIGNESMIEAGLGDEIPTRKFHKKSKSVSLNAKINRDSTCWRTNTEDMSDNKKRIMIALMLKIAILVMMESTCYTFGGKNLQTIK